MRKTFLSLPAAGLLLVAIGCGLALPARTENKHSGGNGNSGGGKNSGSYVLLAWSDLGMHCMDGKDYSVFSVLPPYNTVRAQLFQKGATPVPITSGVTLTYQAMADSTGSINTISSTKTNFWDYVRLLFLAQPMPDVGLTDNKVQSNTPQPMKWNATLNVWEADAIPTVPYDDKGVRNPYPMAMIVARSSSGKVLATATVVLAVSDELSCNVCHASNSNTAAKPAAGWENNPDPLKDPKLNILKKHDDRFDISPYLSALQSKGYTYQSTLLQTAKSGTPVLCAACHSSNALGEAGISGIKPLTQDMHTLHASATNPQTGTTLDNATSPAGSCYLCHPGQQTKCQRGAMNQTACYDCHGNLTQVASPSRQGWLSLPACQMCHTNSTRYASTFSSPGVWRTSNDTHFATTANVPSTGYDLYRFSTGHGGAYCAGCHGSPHSEYPTIQPNDNVYSTNLQGHAGKIAECTVCHSTVPTTANGGPHTIHTIGQTWVTQHHSYASGGGYQQCAYCHDATYRGSALSETAAARTFTVEGRTVSFPAGHAVSCYDCHNGPTGD